MTKSFQPKPGWLLKAEEEDRLGIAREKGKAAYRSLGFKARNPYNPNSKLGRAWKAGLIEQADRDSPW